MKLAYDYDLERPGCALLQALHGANRLLAHRFPVDSWLQFPTPTLKVYEITPAQLDLLVQRAESQYIKKETGTIQ